MGRSDFDQCPPLAGLRRALAANALRPSARFCLWLAAPPPWPRTPGDHAKKVVLPGEVRQATGRLTAVADLVRRARWADAVDEYQRLINEAGDDLVPLDGDGLHGSQRSIQIRRLCHLRIAALPPAALRLYRDRVDVQAEKWLRQGMDERDVRPLRRIVDEAFCSRVGAQALDLLGDLAFEKGNLEEAQSWWQMLAPAPAASGDASVPQLRYPDPPLDLARVMAKHVLARLYQGDVEQADRELKALRRLHPRASGQLAGRTGQRTRDILQCPDRPGSTLDLAVSRRAVTWLHVRGAASARNRPVPARTCRDRRASGPMVRPGGQSGLTAGKWSRHPYAGRRRRGAGDRQRGPGTSPPSAHPVIVEDKVFVADAYQVQGFDLFTGRLLFRYQAQARPGRRRARPGSTEASRHLDAFLPWPRRMAGSTHASGRLFWALRSRRSKNRSGSQLPRLP